MHWYLEAFRRYFDFSGRSRRKEYWFFVLFNAIVSFAIGFVEALIGTGGETGGLLIWIYILVAFIPSLAVSVRRLHDVGRTAWWLFIGLVPVIGFIVLLVFFVQDGDPGLNRYGPDPKGAVGDAALSTPAAG